MQTDQAKIEVQIKSRYNYGEIKMLRDDERVEFHFVRALIAVISPKMIDIALGFSYHDALKVYKGSYERGNQIARDRALFVMRRANHPDGAKPSVLHEDVLLKCLGLQFPRYQYIGTIFTTRGFCRQMSMLTDHDTPLTKEEIDVVRGWYHEARGTKPKPVSIIEPVDKCPQPGKSKVDIADKCDGWIPNLAAQAMADDLNYLIAQLRVYGPARTGMGLTNCMKPGTEEFKQDGYVLYGCYTSRRDEDKDINYLRETFGDLIYISKLRDITSAHSALFIKRAANEH